MRASLLPACAMLVGACCAQQRSPFPECPAPEDAVRFHVCEATPSLCELPLEAVRESEPDAARAWDVVFLGEGFRACQQDAFADHVDTLIAEFLAGSWFTDEEKARFNFYRIDIDADLADRDHPTPGRPLAGCLARADGPGDPVLRTSSRAGVVAGAGDRLGTFDADVVVFNSDEGRANAAVNMQRSDDGRVLAHELGHAIFALGDEYTEVPECALDCRSRGQISLAGGHGARPNLTYDAAGEKWSAYVDGAIEGGGGFEECIYHPTDDCVMLGPSERFCPVCRAVIEGRFETDFVERVTSAPEVCDIRFQVDDAQIVAHGFASSARGVQTLELELGWYYGAGEYNTSAYGEAIAYESVPFCIDGVLPHHYVALTHAREPLDGAAYFATLRCGLADGTTVDTTYYAPDADPLVFTTTPP